MDGGVTLSLLKKGAEAYLYIDDWFGFKVIRKVRVPKSVASKIKHLYKKEVVVVILTELGGRYERS